LNTFIKVKDEFVGMPYPAWTAIGVTELITEGTLLEIRIIAKRA
jgi:enamine deaminase RidA (YjgF/YER057c/UK114 family)